MVGGNPWSFRLTSLLFRERYRLIMSNVGSRRSTMAVVTAAILMTMVYIMRRMVVTKNDRPYCKMASILIVADLGTHDIHI